MPSTILGPFYQSIIGWGMLIRVEGLTAIGGGGTVGGEGVTIPAFKGQ